MAQGLVDVQEYRLEARTWLASNMERRDAAKLQSTARGLNHRTTERTAEIKALLRKVYAAGYAGLTWPKEYGGQGLTPEHERVFAEEAKPYVMPELGLAFAVVAPTVLAHASPEFLARHLPAILSGDEIWCEFFSEPGAGSDLAGITTRATRDGDRWIIRGSKIWSTGAYYSDYGMCLARTDWDVPKHQGLTWFAVRTDAPGLVIQPIREINGDAEFCQEFFDDVEVGTEDIIGEVNRGWAVTQTMLVYERGAGRESAAPRPRGPGPLAPDLVTLAQRCGRAGDATVRQLIARAHTNDFVQAQLGERIGGLIRSGRADPAGLASYGKLASGTFGAQRARLAMEIGRAAVVVWDREDIDGRSPALDYLNGRISAIAGGTNEMQRNGIGERVLGLPREPSFDTTKPFNQVVREAQSWSGKI